MPMSTGVKSASGASKPILKYVPKTNRSLQAKEVRDKRVEEHPRNLNKKNHVDSCLNSRNFVFVSDMFLGCYDCGECLFSKNHDKCVVEYLRTVNARRSKAKKAVAKPNSVWKPVGTSANKTRSQWKPTGRTFSLYDSYPLTRIAESEEMPFSQPPSVSTSDTITVNSRFLDVPITCYQRQGRKAIPVSVVYEN